MKSHRTQTVCWLLLAVAAYAGMVFASPARAQTLDEAQLQNPGPRLKLSLNEAIALALRHNRTIKNAYLNRVLDKFSLKLARDEFKPDFSLSLSSDYRSYQNLQERAGTLALQANLGVLLKLPSGGALALDLSGNQVKDSIENDALNLSGSYTGNLSLNFTQPLLQGRGKDVATADLVYAERQEQSSLLALKQTLTELVNDVISSYQSFQQSQRSLAISRRSLQDSKDLLEINRAMINAGRMAPFEIVLTEADIARQELNLKISENSFDNVRLALLRVLDIDRNTELDIMDDVFEVRQDIPPVKELYQRILDNNPGYLSALLELDNARTALMLAKNQQLWQLDFNASYGVYAQGKSYGAVGNSLRRFDEGDYSAGVTLVVPIDDDQRAQSLLSAQINLQQTEDNLEQMREDLQIELNNALRDLDILRIQVELARREITLRERQLEIEKEKLKVRRSENKDVVDAQESLVNARTSELDAIVEYWNALNSLDALLGTTLDTWGITIEQVGTYHESAHQFQ